MPAVSCRPSPYRRARLVAGAVALACGCGLPGAASAQTLLELYNAARQYDASYLAARAQAESEPYRLEQSRALLRPSASLGSGINRSETNPPSAGHRTANNQQASVSARHPLFNRSSAVTVEQAERLLEVSRYELAGAEQDLIIRLSQAYFDVLAAEDALATTRASKAAISEQLASAKRNFEVGTATITDTREAQARYDLATAQEIAAENDLRNKRTALDQLVGRTGVQPVRLATPLTLPPLVPASADAWASQARAVHPAVQQAQLALQIAQLEIDKARAANLPTVDLVGSVSTSHNTGSALAAQGSRAGTTTGASVGVQLNLPLFSGYSMQNRVKETLVLEQRARHQLDAAQRTVEQATRQAYANLESGRAQVQALEAAEASSLLALEATQLGYRVGVRINLDVLNAQTQLFTTRRDLAQARYNLAIGTLRLRQAAGELGPADVEMVNALLVSQP